MSLLPLLLLCSLGLLPPAGAHPSTATQELYVKPTESISCPEPCHTLDEYVENTTRYFVSNTVFKFLPGTHNLGHPLSVNGVTNIAMVGINGTVNITCNNNSLSFTKISDLVLEDLNFSFYSKLWLSDLMNMSILHLAVQPDEMPLPIILYATNILGKSSLIGLRVFSDYSIINIEYHDNFIWALPGHNQLSIIDLSQHLNTGDTSGMQIGFVLSQSTYSVDLLLQNFTAINGFGISLRDESNNLSTMYLVNCNFTYMVFSLHNITSAEISVQDSQFGSVFISAQDARVHSMSFMLRNVTVTDVNSSSLDHALIDGPGGKSFDGLVTVYRAIYLSFVDCKFLNNYVKGTIASPAGIDSVMLLVDSEEITFVNCEFSGNVGTPITSVNSTFILSGSNTFSNNRAYKGGALAFYGHSYVTLSDGLHVLFVNNSAETVGGAIYVDYVNEQCFFKLQGHYSCQTELANPTPPVNLSFMNNIAENGGDILYGALFDVCLVSKTCTGTDFAQTLFHINRTDDSGLLSPISSDSLRACLCASGKPSCITVFRNLTSHPGETFQLSAVVVGDRFGTVDGSVYAHLSSSTGEIVGLGNLEQSQGAGHLVCTTLSYTIFSNSTDVTLVLTATNVSINQYPNGNDIINAIDEYSRFGIIERLLQSVPVYINVTLLPCPLGFLLSGEPPRCACDTRLQNHGIPCNLTTQTVHRSGTEWVNASFHGNTSNGVIVNMHCPNYYCRPEPVDVNLEHPDTQCAFNHSGILCGGCQSGLSLALGSAQCRTCSNDYLALLIPFALAGFALVFFMKLLNLTVAIGTLNGLIFYANIVRANQVEWIHSGDTNILTIFIAWLNLDLGIETCFFDGLDAYWSMWLQFVFPLYIWAIVILIIILSHYFSTPARIFGSNSVPVLATLFILSYPKLLRTIISIFQSSTLDYPDGTSAAVWSYDGNIPNFSPKHIPLFLVATGVVLFLWLPYTGILFFTQCFQRVSNYKVTRFVMKLKPFFDAYFGPLKDNHRYWVGLLLLLRGVLFISFAATPTSQSDIDLLVTLVAVLCVLIYLAHNGGVYKNNYLSLLENSFFMNLGLLAGGTLYVQQAEKSQSALASTSVGIAFAQFLMIVTIHLIVSLKETWLVRKVRQVVTLGKPQAVDRTEYARLVNEPTPNRNVQQLMVSYDDFREPVLKYLDT